MAYDLKIISSTNGRLYPNTWPDPVFVDGLYSLVQKVYKNLMTQPGTDEQDPGWGSDLRGAIMAANIPVGPEAFSIANAQCKAVVQSVVQKCMLDLSTSVPLDPAQQLADLQVGNVSFEVGATSWNIELTVISGAGDSAVTSFNI